VRLRGAYERQEEIVPRRDIVDVVALAAEEAQILASPDALPDHIRHDGAVWHGSGPADPRPIACCGIVEPWAGT